MTDEQIIQAGIDRGFDPEFCKIERMRWVQENEPERFARMQKPAREQQIEEAKNQIRTCHNYILSYHETIATSKVKGEVYFYQKELEIELDKIQKLQRKLHYLTAPVTKKGITDADIARANQTDPRKFLGEPVRSAGCELVYRVPYREDKHPSLFINTEKGVFIDRGTSNGGTIIQLVMLLRGQNFTEAVKSLI